MTEILLITSVIFYHLPSGLYRDTQRRHNNMVKRGTNTSYDVKNNILPLQNENAIMQIPFARFSSLAAIILPIFCFIALDIYWFYAIILNFGIFILLGPILAYPLTPTMAIRDRTSLLSRAIVFLIIGSFFFLIA